MPSKVAICTIIAKNYLGFAHTLFDSVFKNDPGVDFHLLVIDNDDSSCDEFVKDGIFLKKINEVMSYDVFKGMAYRYDITELSTAVKPFLLQHLLATGYDKVLYLDPDIELFRSLAEIYDLLDHNDVVLTPHILKPIPRDGLQPSESALLNAGAYNLGFLGVKSGSVVDSFLSWWSERLEVDCRIAFDEGLFVDQKWIDLVPGLYENVHILKDPSYNVAYWNLHERIVTEENGNYRVNDIPLAFFHYSGFKTEYPDVLSRHQSRTKFCGYPVLKKLFDSYRSRLIDNGHLTYKDIPYVPLHTDTVEGVNVSGYLSAELGVGESGRSYARAIEYAGIPLSLYDFSAGTSSRLGDSTFTDFSSENPYDVNLICVNADQVPNFIEQVGSSYLSGKVNVGSWWWELPDFPSEWVDRYDYFDQIWVGSNFIKQTLEKSSPVPVYTVPPVVEFNLDKKHERSDYGLLPDEFVFLFSFDFFSIFERKNPIALVRAFKKAFDQTEKIRLVIKCINGDKCAEQLSLLKKEVSGAKITILEDYFDKDKKNGLFEVVDCYVSLHRSEGFGYTLAEAMLLGKPVIATGWSGNMDFMNQNNSFPVDFKLVQIRQDHGPYKQGNFWAEPDVDHAAKLMRQVFEDPEAAGVIGLRGRAFIEKHYSLSAQSSLIEQRLSELQGLETRYSAQVDSSVNIPGQIEVPGLFERVLKRLYLKFKQNAMGKVSISCLRKLVNKIFVPYFNEQKVVMDKFQRSIDDLHWKLDNMQQFSNQTQASEQSDALSRASNVNE